MKNIFEIMKSFGLEVPTDKQKDFEKEVLENYKTVSDYDIQTVKVNQLNETIKANDAAIKDLNSKLAEFKDVDVSGMKDRIAQFETEKQGIVSKFEAQLADRDFDDLVKDCISTAKGRNAKAITALLDIETLKKSKNQKEDIAAALKALTEAEDSKMLFGEAEGNPTGKGSPIGSFGSGGSGDTVTAQMRSIMGLPPVSK